MAQNTPLTVGPVALTTTLTTNIFNCAITSLAGPVGVTLTQPYYLCKHIRISNKTASAATCSLWLGGTAGNVAGTELLTGVSVPANSYIDQYFPNLRMDSTLFLVGGSNTATALTFSMDGEIGFVS